MKNKVCCFGEILLRLSPDTNNNNWLYVNSMPFYIGGAELNAAAALANWHIPVKYVSALPDNYLSKQIVQFTEEKNIDCSAIRFGGAGIGIYYLPVGLELKNTSVIYDRAKSSFSALRPGMIDWDKVLDDCSWFHFSAISPALSQNLAELCAEALEVATSKGLTVSVDLNYRSKLWQYGKQPVDVMPELVKHCDIIMGNLWAVESLLGVQSPIESSTGKSQDQLLEAAAQSISRLHAAFPKAKTFAYTFRLDSTYMAVLQNGNDWAVSRKFNITNVVDKVGSGDCFMAGLVYGLYRQLETKNIIDFAAAAAVGKLQEAGDSTNQTIGTVNRKIRE